MLTMRENYLIAARGGKPEWVPCFPNEVNMFVPPVWDVDPETGTDFCNIKYVHHTFGDMPDPNWQAMEDVADWKDIVRFPDLDAIDWQKLADDFFNSETYDPDKVTIAMPNAAGIFLVPVNMMGWVDALCAIHEDPENLGELVDALTDFIIGLVEKIGEYIHPDIMFSGDDVASSTGPFISKEVWDSMYGPNFARIADAIHAQGALAEFHCCGRCGYLIDEFLAAGYDIVQLAIPNDELRADKARLGNKLVMTGGWARHSDAGMPGASEEVVRQSVRTALDDFGKDGALIFWDGGVVGNDEDAKNKMAWLMDELKVYGGQIYK